MANFLPYTKLKAEDLNAAFAEKADDAATLAALALKADLVGGKVPTNQLPDAVLGALSYQEAWDAATNTPSIPAAGDANKGHYYVVQVAGTTAIDGESDWQIGDWIVSNGAYWEKVDNSDKVSSVNGKAGPVVLSASDVGAEPAMSEATELEMASGTEAGLRSMSPLRVRQAISALSKNIAVIAYADRANLRSTSPATDDLALVENLGLFVFKEGSDEPDDDESCFATASGRWLLEAPHWNVIDSWQLPDSFDERFHNEIGSRFLFGTATCAITTVNAASSASFTGTVTGAVPGDRVIATPPSQLGSDATNTGRFSYHAWVSATGTVTVMLSNPSAANATTNASIRTAWPITVIKGA